MLSKYALGILGDEVKVLIVSYDYASSNPTASRLWVLETIQDKNS